MSETGRYPGLLEGAYFSGKPNPIRATTIALRKQRQRQRYGSPSYAQATQQDATSAPQAASAVQSFDAHDVKGQRAKHAEELKLHRQTQLRRLKEATK